MSQNVVPSFSIAVDSVGIRRATVTIEPAQVLRPRFVKDEDTYRYNSVAAYLSAVASSWAYSDVIALRDQLSEVMQTNLECIAFEAHNPTMYLDTDA